ncbi:MAG: hypothetical protein U9Q21_02515 [Candidatus Auribacterota bacterium]|nr:hypothetical protein [Candidatus Auribacterota bacterium]
MNTEARTALLLICETCIKESGCAVKGGFFNPSQCDYIKKKDALNGE